MDDSSERKKNLLTNGVNDSKEVLPGEDGEETMMTRRSVLLAAGAAGASLAGCTGSGSTGNVELQPLGVYGYGGNPVLSSASETITTAESEPNDTRKEAMEVSLGTEIDGELTTAEADWFAFDAEAGQTVIVEFSRSAADGVTSVILYGLDGDYQDLVFVGTDDPTRLEETLGATGTHYVEVVDIQQSAGGYTLGITTDAEETSTPTPTATPTETQTATPTATPTETQTATSLEDDYGEQVYGGYGYGGVDA